MGNEQKTRTFSSAFLIRILKLTDMCQPWVEGVAQAVADQVEAKHG
jgi:hypothetical protein